MIITKIQKELKNKELDGMLISSAENRRYVCGFTGSAGLLLITCDDAVLFVDGRYTTQARLETKNLRVEEYKSAPYKLLNEYCLHRLAIEDKSLPFAEYKKLKEEMSTAELACGSEIMERLRIVKTADEIECIRKAAEISDSAFSYILDFVEPGLTEQEIALELELFMRHNGAEGVAFDTIAASGEYSALPHARTTNRVVKHGDMLLLDFGCKYNGYCSDMTRTVAVGGASAENIKVYNAVLAAQTAAIEVVKSGVVCAAVDKTARDVITSLGYAGAFNHSLGHGVGMEVHELPLLSPKSDKKLAAGNCITVEPGIYLPGKFGVRIEDLVVVTEDGCVNLTNSTKEFLVI